ncbi:MAG TPA: hypothetical protein VMZ91_02870 [Candidatus Paceibacterota bacterium]|nr:hypothetical protein [Candidatus Paceibacterota bacterium]
MSPDEKAAQKEAKEYGEAIDIYGLDNIEDGWGQDHKRYMIDAFFSGFYAGRDYQRDKISDKKIIDIIEKLIEYMKKEKDDFTFKEIRVKWFNIIEELRF